MKGTFKIYIEIERVENGFSYKRFTTQDEEVVTTRSLVVQSDYTYSLSEDLILACKEVTKLHATDVESRTESKDDLPF